MRTTITDFNLALREIDLLLEKYEPKHHGAWRSQPLEVHVNHAIEHLQEVKKAFSDPDRRVTSNPEGIISGACRAIMALQISIIDRINRSTF